MHEPTKRAAASKVTAAYRLMEEMREMLNDIAASATILGGTPFDGRHACRELSAHLHRALLEFEVELADIGRHEFEVKES